MRVIGLTGGIGSGKSTVSRLLAELGAVIIDADKVGHEAFKPDTELWREIVTTFGQQVLTPVGEIDREKLGAIVFDDPESLAQLNRIMHSRMYDIVKGQLEQYRQQGVPVVVLEAALLLEADWTAQVEEVWVTVAPEATVIKRLMERTGLSEAQSLARIHAQISNEDRIKQADVVIDTDCSLDELKAKVEGLWGERAFDT
jgi:dephospho-CoA kinase